MCNSEQAQSAIEKRPPALRTENARMPAGATADGCLSEERRRAVAFHDVAELMPVSLRHCGPPNGYRMISGNKSRRYSRVETPGSKFFRKALSTRYCCVRHGSAFAFLSHCSNSGKQGSTFTVVPE